MLKSAALQQQAVQAPIRPVSVNSRTAVRCCSCRAGKKDTAFVRGLEDSRRQVLLGLAAGASLVAVPAAQAEGNIPVVQKANDEYAIFYGFATPPTSYGKRVMCALYVLCV